MESLFPRKRASRAALSAFILLTPACSEDLLVGSDPAPSTTTGTGATSTIGSEGGGGGGGTMGCPTEGWGQFTVLDHFSADTMSPPGCSTEIDAADSALRIYSPSGTDPTRIEFRVRRNDEADFVACPNCLVLYVGQGPYCGGVPINVVKQDKALGGHDEQILTLQADEEYKEDWKWNEGETKQFWVSYQSATGFSASGMVLIERRCVPSNH